MLPYALAESTWWDGAKVRTLTLSHTALFGGGWSAFSGDYNSNGFHHSKYDAQFPLLRSIGGRSATDNIGESLTGLTIMSECPPGAQPVVDDLMTDISSVKQIRLTCVVESNTDIYALGDSGTRCLRANCFFGPLEAQVGPYRRGESHTPNALTSADRKMLKARSANGGRPGSKIRHIVYHEKRVHEVGRPDV